MTVAISMMRSRSGSSPVISRSIQIRFSFRFTATLSVSPRALAKRAFERTTTQHVQMDVKHDLAAFPIDVHDHAIARQSVISRKTFRGKQEAADQCGMIRIEVVQRGDVSLRNDEPMNRRLRMDVLEGDDRVVLVDTIRRQLARHDLAK